MEAIAMLKSIIFLGKTSLNGPHRRRCVPYFFPGAHQGSAFWSPDVSDGMTGN